MVQNQRATPDDNDPTDVEMLPGYCYADLVLTEKRMCGHIHSADSGYKSRVFARPETLLAALGLREPDAPAA